MLFYTRKHWNNSIKLSLQGSVNLNNFKDLMSVRYVSINDNTNHVLHEIILLSLFNPQIDFQYVYPCAHILNIAIFSLQINFILSNKKSVSIIIIYIMKKKNEMPTPRTSAKLAFSTMEVKLNIKSNQRNKIRIAFYTV
uniref:Uncharacterized protein n=1 Tax=Cacopsylla melanoneura TaxID=428564 RepID=A0A8D8Y7G5_9HEMI